jgi:two-component system, OmpR family, response regulator CpxR
VTSTPIHIENFGSSLLLIDDDKSLGALIAEYCIPNGFSITTAITAEEGILLLRQNHFALLILDVMLPGIDGFEALARIRYSSNIPVLMLTTRGASRDRVRGLENGADDYLPKPFQPEELLARIRSILRRTQPRSESTLLMVGDVTLNELERSVTVLKRPVELTGAEFHLLKLLLSQPGIPLAREELVSRIFGREINILDRSVDNLAHNIRKKLGTHSNGLERIKSVRNIGYTYVLATRAQGTS